MKATFDLLTLLASLSLFNIKVMVTSAVNKLASRWQRVSTVAFTGTSALMIDDKALISLLGKAKDSPSGRLMSINAFCIQFFNK